MLRSQWKLNFRNIRNSVLVPLYGIILCVIIFTEKFWGFYTVIRQAKVDTDFCILKFYGCQWHLTRYIIWSLRLRLSVPYFWWAINLKWIMVKWQFSLFAYFFRSPMIDCLCKKYELNVHFLELGYLNPVILFRCLIVPNSYSFLIAYKQKNQNKQKKN